jgi:hypothetical protein
MLDRLLHRSVVLNIDGPSYRMRAHRARAEATNCVIRRKTDTGSGARRTAFRSYPDSVPELPGQGSG